jgi:hypothetical protein
MLFSDHISHLLWTTRKNKIAGKLLLHNFFSPLSSTCISKERRVLSDINGPRRFQIFKLQCYFEERSEVNPTSSLYKLPSSDLHWLFGKHSPLALGTAYTGFEVLGSSKHHRFLLLASVSWHRDLVSWTQY